MFTLPYLTAEQLLLKKVNRQYKSGCHKRLAFFVILEAENRINKKTLKRVPGMKPISSGLHSNTLTASMLRSYQAHVQLFQMNSFFRPTV